MSIELLADKESKEECMWILQQLLAQRNKQQHAQLAIENSQQEIVQDNIFQDEEVIEEDIHPSSYDWVKLSLALLMFVLIAATITTLPYLFPVMATSILSYVGVQTFVWSYAISGTVGVLVGAAASTFFSTYIAQAKSNEQPDADPQILQPQ